MTREESFYQLKVNETIHTLAEQSSYFVQYDPFKYPGIDPSELTPDLLVELGVEPVMDLSTDVYQKRPEPTCRMITA